MALSKGEVMPHPDLNALAAFIDRRLSEADHAGVVAHLAGCAECRAVVAAHARGQGSRVLFRPAVWLPIAATLALATTAALILSRDRGPIAPSPAPPLALPSRPPVDTAPQPSATPPTIVIPPPADPGSLATRRGAVQRIKGHTKLPVCVGFGVSTPALAAEIARYADGVVVGGAIVDRIEQAKSPAAAVEAVARFVAELKAPLRAA